MPLVGYTCPPGAPTEGERHSIQHCLGTCAHPCVAGPLLLAMYEAEQRNHHKGAYISASMLAGSSCPRQQVLERMRDFYDHPTRRYWPFRGTHAHTIIEHGAERARQFGWLQELRMQVPVTYPNEPAPVFDDAGNFTGHFDASRPLVILVGGTTDAYMPQRRWLADFKSLADTKAWSFALGEKGGTYSPYFEDKYVLQLNVYRWLVAHTKVPDDAKDLCADEYFPAPTRLMIQAISMMLIPQSGTTTAVKLGRARRMVDIPDVPVLPLNTIEQFVRDEALKWYRWLVLGQAAPIVPKEHDWMCRTCVFNGEIVPGEPCMPTAERTAQTALVLDEPGRSASDGAFEQTADPSGRGAL